MHEKLWMTADKAIVRGSTSSIILHLRMPCCRCQYSAAIPCSIHTHMHSRFLFDDIQPSTTREAAHYSLIDLIMKNQYSFGIKIMMISLNCVFRLVFIRLCAVVKLQFSNNDISVTVSEQNRYIQNTVHCIITKCTTHSVPNNYNYIHHCDWLSLDCHAYPSHFKLAQPCCSVGRFNSRRVRSTGEADVWA